MINLPDHPTPQAATPGLVDFGAFLTPSLGGPVQRVERMGSRFRIAVTMPPMPNLDYGRQWVAKLVRGKQEGVRMPWPLLGFDPGSPGDVFVHTTAGVGQSGRLLQCNGGTPNYVFREGQFFSLTSRAGRSYLYMVTAETAWVSGGFTLPIEPMLRVPALENDPLNFGKPMIEGFIMGDSFAWEMALANFVGISFDLVEIE
jgi:hypothetical protein